MSSGTGNVELTQNKPQFPALVKGRKTFSSAIVWFTDVFLIAFGQQSSLMTQKNMLFYVLVAHYPLVESIYCWFWPFNETSTSVVV